MLIVKETDGTLTADPAPDAKGSMRGDSGEAVAVLVVAEKPALEGDAGSEKVTKNGFFGDFSPTDLPRNEGQIRPLIEKLEHNGERFSIRRLYFWKI